MYKVTRLVSAVLLIAVMTGCQNNPSGTAYEKLNDPSLRGYYLEALTEEEIELAASECPAGEGDGEDELCVMICHVPPGNPEARKTLVVGLSAVNAHLNHGESGEKKGKGKGKNKNTDSEVEAESDYLGTCDAPLEEEAPAPEGDASETALAESPAVVSQGEVSQEEIDQNTVACPESEGGEQGTCVEICHVPPGNPAARHTIIIGLPALEAHLKHGSKGKKGSSNELSDYLGKCDDDSGEVPDDENPNPDPGDGGSEDPGTTPAPDEGGEQDPGTTPAPDEGGEQDPGTAPAPDEGGEQDPGTAPAPDEGGGETPDDGGSTPDPDTGGSDPDGGGIDIGDGVSSDPDDGGTNSDGDPQFPEGEDHDGGYTSEPDESPVDQEEPSECNPTSLYDLNCDGLDDYSGEPLS